MLFATFSIEKKCYLQLFKAILVQCILFSTEKGCYLQRLLSNGDQVMKQYACRFAF